VAKALSTVFSRYGFVQEILSDQGSDFMSELMQIFLSDFGRATFELVPTIHKPMELVRNLMALLRRC